MKVFQFSQQGKRKNNEDYLGINDALLTVCDGMGGHNYGERAAVFVVEQMLQCNEKIAALQKNDIQKQLNYVQNSLNQLLEKEPELEKMGTTFTGVFRTPDLWYAAHIGDSRIYLFRPSERKLWHTWDHSLVGELMRNHEITIEAGRFHPMSNCISKAIIAQNEGKLTTASIVRIDELKTGDILLLCSDGVVEAWSDWAFVQLFADSTLGFQQKCEKIAELCNTASKDNNTAILAEIEESDTFSYGNNEELIWTTFDEVEADYNQYLKESEPTVDGTIEEKLIVEGEQTSSLPEETHSTGEEVNKQPKPRANWYWIVPIIVSALVALFVLFTLSRTSSEESMNEHIPNEKSSQEINNQQNDNIVILQKENDNEEKIILEKKHSEAVSEEHIQELNKW